MNVCRNWELTNGSNIWYDPLSLVNVEGFWLHSLVTGTNQRRRDHDSMICQKLCQGATSNLNTFFSQGRRRHRANPSGHHTRSKMANIRIGHEHRRSLYSRRTSLHHSIELKGRVVKMAEFNHHVVLQIGMNADVKSWNLSASDEKTHLIFEVQEFQRLVSAILDSAL
jgi:hypothetical protein